jgi:hypothetical protein
MKTTLHFFKKQKRFSIFFIIGFLLGSFLLVSSVLEKGVLFENWCKQSNVDNIIRIFSFLIIFIYPTTLIFLEGVLDFLNLEKKFNTLFPTGSIISDEMGYFFGAFIGVMILGALGILWAIGSALFYFIQFIIATPNFHKFFGILSAIIVLASYPPYIIRIWQNKIIPNIASWTIFVTLSIALSLSSFSSSGFGSNSWVTLGPLLGCSCVLISALIKSKEKSMSTFDKFCLVLACWAIALWYFTKQSQNLVQYALYLGIATDLIGLLPTSAFLIKNPNKDRPGMWLIFSFGYALSMFAITENTFANWSLPVFMTIAPALGWFPLVKYRIKNNIPIKEWI